MELKRSSCLLGWKSYARWLAPLALTLLGACNEMLSAGPYQATGLKIGEVTATEALVWTRLTRSPERVGDEAQMPEFIYRNPDTGELEDVVWSPASSVTFLAEYGDWEPVTQYPPGASIEYIEGAVPGVQGEVRILYRPTQQTSWQSTAWLEVEPERDFTKQLRLVDLSPSTKYELKVEARAPGSQQVASTLDGRFKTAPLPDDPARVVFAVTTGQAYPHQDAPGGGFKMYPSIVELDPSFFVHTGDIVYYDHWAKSIELARWGWARMYSLPTNLTFHRQVPSYFMKDDHDTWFNDSWPTLDIRLMGDFTFEQGQTVFLEQVPMGDLTYRTFRWGQDVQIWLVEGRDYRSPNSDPDGPNKTIWGPEQLAWFRETVQESDATFRILISPTPLVGPVPDNKIDNHANAAFANEGQALREFISQQDNMIVICGDRHWQYISVDNETGLREYASGPASDEHAGGWSNDDYRPQHRYLNVIGGFLAVTAERREGIPTLLLRHHGVDGDILNEDVLVAD